MVGVKASARVLGLGRVMPAGVGSINLAVAANRTRSLSRTNTACSYCF